MKILLADWGMPFGLNTPNVSPLGGSEYSILLLAKGLNLLGHSVILLNSSQTSPEQNDKLIVGSISNFNEVADQSDIILLNRSIPHEIIPFIGKKPIYVWCHDAYDQDIVKQYMHSNLFNIITNLFCVSEWQKQTFCNYLKIPSDKIKVLSNPVDLNLFSGYTKRNLNQLIFSSIPYKGLSEIPRIFNDIVIKTKRDDLIFKIFSSMTLLIIPKQTNNIKKFMIN
jgi:glycosyltransferase involved in cell wall biosynthesis